jgi:V-type H+-transporting ATPase subunit A
MVPPGNRGTVTYVAAEGEYNIHEHILEIEYDGKKSKFCMSHFWPVRKPRPC